MHWSQGGALPSISLWAVRTSTHPHMHSLTHKYTSTVCLKGTVHPKIVIIYLPQTYMMNLFPVYAVLSMQHSVMTQLLYELRRFLVLFLMLLFRKKLFKDSSNFWLNCSKRQTVWWNCVFTHIFTHFCTYKYSQMSSKITKKLCFEQYYSHTGPTEDKFRLSFFFFNCLQSLSLQMVCTRKHTWQQIWRDFLVQTGSGPGAGKNAGWD